MSTDTPALTTARQEDSDYVHNMRFGVLGSIEAFEKKRRLPVGGPKQRTVLALLVARAGTPVSTDALVEGVYGDEPPQGARRSVQTYVSNLRGDLGDAIEAEGSGYRLKADRSEVDALRFEDAVGEAAKIDDPERASEILRDALALWRGHAYADVDGLFELTAERSRLSELRMSAIEARVDSDLKRGHHRQLIAELDSLTEEHPLRERFRAQQMLALYRCGRQAEALRAYEKTRTYLVDEMGLDPSPDLRELEQQILDQDPSLGFETGPTVIHAAILVADIADPRILPTLDPIERHNIVTHQSDAISGASQEYSGDMFAHRGSAIYVSFEDVEHAVGAAIATQQALAKHQQGMRMAISVGEVQIPQDETVQGPPVTRAARLVSAAHGGQVLLSSEANQALAESGGAGWIVRSLGQHDVDGSGDGRPVYQLMVDGLERDFPPLRSELLPLPLPVASRGLPGYELREEVGSGAFGVVHRAYQPSVGREVAIKIVRPEYANDPQFIRRFEVEAQLVARLEHPHIVPLHDYWRNPDGAYLVMRWLGGGTLKARIARARLTLDEAHDILADIGPALDFAHRQGVVHRDIKPSNVLLDDDGGAYLTDFGVARDTALQGVGSVAEDVQALAVVLQQCIGDSGEQAVAELLSTTTAGKNLADVRSFIAAWEEAVGSKDSAPQVVGFTPTRNPYKGLASFSEIDATDFFGRDDLVGQFTTSLESHDLVAAVGPSGIGKSSVVKAGLIPALRDGTIEGSDQWLITTMVPGAFPFDELASALLRVAVNAPANLEDVLRKDERGFTRAMQRYLPEGATLVLVIDQFEELFTLCPDEDIRVAFLDSLVASLSDASSRLRIVLTIRADFFDRPLAYGAFGSLMQQATVPVTSPTRDELLDMIRRPATEVAVSFESGLPERIADEVRDQPGGLPLLEFALTELFDNRDSDLMTFTSYEMAGGVLAALGRRAEATYQSLDAPNQEACQNVFLRMVTVNESGRDTRRRVRLSEIRRLGYDPQTVDAILSAFAVHRLVTFDRDPITRGPTVEVAHEAILTEWSRLADSLDHHRDELLLERRLQAALGEWENSEHADGYLLTGGRLTQYEQLATSGTVALTTRETDYLSVSRAHDDQLQARRRKRRNLVTTAFGFAAVIGLVLATAAFFAQQSATAQRETAEGRALAAAAVGVLEEDPELSLLLSLQSAATADLDFEGRQALRSAIAEHRTTSTWTWDHPLQWIVWPSTSPDGSLVAVSGHFEVIEVWDISAEEPEKLWEVAVPPGYGADVSFSSDGQRVGAYLWWQGWLDVTLPPEPPDASALRGVWYYDAITGELLDHFDSVDTRCTSADEPQQGPQQRWNAYAHLDVDGVWVEMGTCSDLEGRHWWLVDGHTGERTTEPTPVEEDVSQITVTANGWLLEVHDAHTTLTNVITGAERDFPRSDIIFPSISNSGTYLIGAEAIIDSSTGEDLWRYVEPGNVYDGLIPACFAEQANLDETIIYVACDNGIVGVHDARTGRRITSLRGQQGWVAASSNAEGYRLVTGSADSTARVWDLERARGLERFRFEQGYHADSSLHVVGTTGTVLVYPDETSSPFDGAISTIKRVSPAVAVVFDIHSGVEIARVQNVTGKATRLSPDGSQLAVQSVGDAQESLGSIQIHGLSDDGVPRTMTGNCEWTLSAPSEDCPFAGSPFAVDVTDLHWSPDGRYLAAAGGSSQRVIVWDADSGAVVFATDQLGVFPFSSIQFSPDGTLLAASSKTGTWIFETHEWSEVTFLSHPARPSWAMRFTPDGSELVTAQAHRGQLRIYDTTTWEERDIATGRGQSRDMAISESGYLVALANNVGVIHIVDIRTGAILETYPLPRTDITNVEFIDNDRRLLVTTAFGPVEILTLNTEELIAEARTRAIRTFTETECTTYSIEPCPTLEEIRSD